MRIVDNPQHRPPALSSYARPMRFRLLVVLLVISAPAMAQMVMEIAPDVYLLPGAFVPGSQPDGNTVVIDAPRGLVVVDTGRHETHTRAIVDFANTRQRLVTAIVNSHWHLDHIGGNLLLRSAYPGVRVHGSSALDDALKGFLANYRSQLSQLIGNAQTDAAREAFQREAALIDAGSQLAADVVIDESDIVNISGRRLFLGVERRAVTAADVWVYDPKSRVLVAGDLVTMPGPFLDTACPSGWKEALDRIADVDFEILVPGHGAPMSREDFELWREAYGNLLTCASSPHRKQECVGGWTKDLAPLLHGQDQRFTRALMEYYVDLLRGDPAKIAALCGQ